MQQSLSSEAGQQISSTSWNLSFITLFVRVPSSFFTRATLIQPVPPHCNIIPLYISLIFQVVSMWKVPHYNPICSSLLHHPWHMPHPSHLPCFDQSSIMCWSIKFIQLLNEPFSVTSCYFLHLRHTYLPQQSILQLPCPLFYTQCDSLSFTSTCNNSKNYSSVYFSRHVLRQQI